MYVQVAWLPGRLAHCWLSTSRPPAGATPPRLRGPCPKQLDCFPLAVVPQLRQFLCADRVLSLVGCSGQATDGCGECLETSAAAAAWWSNPCICMQRGLSIPAQRFLPWPLLAALLGSRCPSLGRHAALCKVSSPHWCCCAVAWHTCVGLPSSICTPKCHAVYKAEQGAAAI
jgi:hypothetical protein